MKGCTYWVKFQDATDMAGNPIGSRPSLGVGCGRIDMRTQTNFLVVCVCIIVTTGAARASDDSRSEQARTPGAARFERVPAHKDARFEPAPASSNRRIDTARGQSSYRRDWPRDGWIVGTCVIAGAGAAIAERSLEPIALREIDRLSRDDVNGFDRPAIDNYSERISDASYFLAGAAVAAPLALLLYPDVRDDWRTFSLMYAETAALAIIIPALAKGTVGRYRPYAYNPGVPMDTRAAGEAKASFFSRHASMAFASAVFLSTVHDTYRPRSRAGPYLWCGSLLAASAVGIMRVESGDHFPTDVIVGAAVGGAVGYCIPRLHRAGHPRLSLSPACRGPQLGVAVELRI